MAIVLATYGDLCALYTSVATQLTTLQDSPKLKLKAPSQEDMAALRSYRGLLKFILGTVERGLARSEPAISAEARVIQASNPFEIGSGCLLLSRIKRQWTLPVSLIRGYDRFPTVVDVARSVAEAEERQAARTTRLEARQMRHPPVVPVHAIQGSRMAEIMQRAASL